MGPGAAPALEAIRYGFSLGWNFGRPGGGRPGSADPARHYFGIARKRAARRLSENGSIPPGGLWSKRTTVVPITDQSHFENVVDYIQRHKEEGAVIWVNDDYKV